MIFTSGGTEANSLALTPGLRRDSSLPIKRLIVAAIEHASVLAGGRFPRDAIETLGVRKSGVVDHVADNDVHALLIVRDIVATLNHKSAGHRAAAT